MEDKRRTPVEMARIAQELKLIAMKPVAAVGENVEQGNGSGDGKQEATQSGLRVGFTCLVDPALFDLNLASQRWQLSPPAFTALNSTHATRTASSPCRCNLASMHDEGHQHGSHSAAVAA